MTQEYRDGWEGSFKALGVPHSICSGSERSGLFVPCPGPTAWGLRAPRPVRNVHVPNPDGPDRDSGRASTSRPARICAGTPRRSQAKESSQFSLRALTTGNWEPTTDPKGQPNAVAPGAFQQPAGLRVNRFRSACSGSG